MSKNANPNGTNYRDQVNDNLEENISSTRFNKKAHSHNLERPSDFSIVWNESGILEPGVKFQASEVKPSDPKE